MPTEIRRSTAPSIARSSTLRLSPATIVLTFAFAAFHLVSGVLLERSQASPAIASSAFSASSDEAICAMETPPLPDLPYD